MQIAGVAAFMSAMALSISSFAATVMPEQGIVLINRGNGYETATGPTAVNPGDIVVVNPGASAQITYSDGCTVPVAVGTIVTVGAQSPCTTQGSMTPSQASIPPPEGDVTTPPPGDVTLDTIGVGDLAISVAVAGAAVGGVLLTQKDRPASP